MTHLGLFEGIGGFSLAARWMGWETIAWCEKDSFCQKVLSYHFPNAKKHDDIKQTDFTIYRGRVDILTGGFPCQPYSTAGKRLGKNDERHLWPEMLRAIKEVQPTWIVGENVIGLVNWSDGVVFEEVQIDLEREGYEVQAYVLPAAGVNAPHQRYRIWFVAYCNSNGCTWNQKLEKIDNKRIRKGMEKRYEFNALHGIGLASNTTSKRWFQYDKKYESGQPSQNIPDWERFPTQSPVCNGNDGISTRLDGITFSRLRRESIKAGGNAVVPQVVLQIYKTIEQYELLNQ